MFVTTAVPYLSTGLAGCLIDPEINRGARKLPVHLKLSIIIIIIIIIIMFDMLD
jgi:hypothetical protein